MIQNASPEFSLLDEALPVCSDGHCVFDEERKLVSWSVTFADHYVKLYDKIKPGYPYEEFVRDLVDREVLKNLKLTVNVDEWIAHHLSELDGNNAEFIHQFEDDKRIVIKHTVLSNGYWFFVANDITAVFMQKEALQDSESRFEGFAKTSSDWFWELDRNLQYTYFSSHNAPLGVLGQKDLVGVSRIEHVSKDAVDNRHLKEHNAALKEHREVKAVLSWQPLDDTNEFIHVQVNATPKYNRHGEFTGFLGCVKNVTTEYGLKQQLEFQAAHDELTGLINRRAFGQYLNLSLKNLSVLAVESDAPSDTLKTITLVNLDQFKMVNDNAGHLAGDQLLRGITTIFKNVYSHRDDIIARVSGDEFAILSAGNANAARLQAEVLIKKIGEYRFLWQEKTYSVGASAGIVVIDSTSSDDSDLLSKADAACNAAKMSGRNQAHLYSSKGAFVSGQNDEIGKLALINDALENDRVNLYLQPIVQTGDETEIRKFEVLLRLFDSNGELVSPGEVIPIAEKYDRMPHLDIRIIEKTIHSIEQFYEMGVPVALSVNLSGNTLSNEACLDRITKLVDEHKVKSGSLCFEITETAAIKGIEKAYRFIDQLKKRGCQFSLDDFGSGLSSFSYLRSLDVDYLKIDGCFVMNLVDDPSNRAIVTSFNTLAHELGMKTVAECVETDEITALLKEIDVDYLQGFGVGRPQDIGDWFEFFGGAREVA